ncbi:unnamed protein product [Polarella glacialis]|uniref:LAGLIDADG endonuclease n=1 Tax=Polarella glacialis TaxID=89957 RepID=A0A813H751_POLGL|nr:unnamed protein product [Polarella glacialis]
MASIRQDQLIIVADWPDSKIDRTHAASNLRILTSFPPAVKLQCSWDYVAGFFDGEGCIRVPSVRNSFRLHISQLHRQMLVEIIVFIQAELPQLYLSVTVGPGMALDLKSLVLPVVALFWKSWLRLG